MEAQAGTYDQALRELRAGRKTSHWMWFVFPQLVGLGESAMAQRYAIADLDEARAYLHHPRLGARLIECVAAVNGLSGQTAEAVFGFPDVLKFRSCLTLFAEAAPSIGAFGEALALYYGGERCARTLELMAEG